MTKRLQLHVDRSPSQLLITTLLDFAYVNIKVEILITYAIAVRTAPLTGLT